jgi:Ti-type conjugative transfer relaxase TraA
MANFHGTMKMISRQGGKSCVASLAYRSATRLEDQRTGEVWDYTQKGFVGHVEIMTPEGAPQWIVDLAQECKINRQAALQKLSNIFEAAENRKDSQVYREFEFSLPNELMEEQNIAWAKDFIHHTFVKKGMVAIPCFHFDVDRETGMAKPHCHLLLSTRDLAEDGFGLKNRTWNDKSLCEEAREQCAAYQNLALKEHGFEVQVSHLSYADRGLDIDPQPKRGAKIIDMTERGIETDKQKIFDMVRLKNQFKIVKNPELVFSIVTSKHSTFTRKDIAKVLHRYIDDADQFRILLDRLMASKDLVDLESREFHKDTQEPVYTTKEMLRIEMGLVKTVEGLAAQQTHKVASGIVDGIMARHNEKLAKYGGLSADQIVAIRHMLSSDQISCVIGFAGAGKTTCLEAVKEAWEEAGYKVIGLAPTGKAARNIESCGIRSMTLHKFLHAQTGGREQISSQTVVIVDEAGMVDSRRFAELLSLIDTTGAKIVLMGDGNQLQSVEAGPAFRLLADRVNPAVLETVVRQQTDWQREATRLFGTLHTKRALTLYQEKGCFTTIQEKMPDLSNKGLLLDHYCLARQMSGRIWKEMLEDVKTELGDGKSFDPETDFEVVSRHQDFNLFKDWKKTRQGMVERIIGDYDNQQHALKDRGADVKTLDSLVAEYKAAPVPNTTLFKDIESILRQMSYEHIADTRDNTRQEMVNAWAKDYHVSSDQSHLMLAFTNKDANKLNEEARAHMREQGNITGKDYTFNTQRIDEDDFGKEVITYQDRTFAQGDRLLFTRNNNSLNVKNGSLGTILELSQQKLTVALDGDAQRTVSFSPYLYPFIDNGWATTIHKAQGVTVDHVKMLASFEQYRNLSYVGMSRHRHTLQVFGSSLDFWREDKIIDRLSRIQDKLSGFDYLDADKIQEVLAEDTDALWHQQKIQQGKDFWSAIKVTAKDIFNKVLDRAQEDKGTKEEFLTFEDTEEMRSRDFFKDQASHQAKEPPVAKGGAKASQSISHDQPSLETEKLEAKARLLKLESNNLKRQQFEKERLPINQEWCATLGFMVQHKRLPEPHEIGWAYWQGERLTAIEGRLYGEKLEAGTKKIDEEKLTLQARGELSKNQAAPKYIMAVGHTSKLTQAQLKQFEQHILMRRDKTGRVPEPVDLDHICKAIKVHDQLMGQEIKQTINSPKMAENPDTYRILIEQQTVLAHLMKDNVQDAAQVGKNIPDQGVNPPPQSTNEQDIPKAPHNQDIQQKAGSQEYDEIDIKGREMPSKIRAPLAIKVDDIRDACSGRLQKFNDKVQELKDFNQRMADLKLRRQNDRGMGMDM